MRPGSEARWCLAALATWRITHLLASEDGPADIVARLRARLGSGLLGELADCFQCLSIWVALPMALVMGRRRSERLIGWFGLSGAACLLETMATRGVADVMFDDQELDQKG